MNLKKKISFFLPIGLMRLTICLIFACVIFYVRAEKSETASELYFYKGGLVAGVNGPVKEVSVNGSLLQKQIGKTKFLKNGKLKNRLMSYDKEGKPIGFGMNNGNTYIYTNISYSPDGRISSAQSRCKLKDKEAETTLTYTLTYNGKDLSETQCLAVVSDGSEPETLTVNSYSDYKYDSHGNWISRNVKKRITNSAADPKSQEEEYTETRQIKYYEK